MHSQSIGADGWPSFGPLRDNEGRLRTPFLIRWPNEIKPGSVDNEIRHIANLFPPIAKVTNAKFAANRLIDEIDLLEFLTGKSNKSDCEGFPVYNSDNLQAYQWRNWKLHFLRKETMRSDMVRPGMPRLYNLLTDPKENYDLIEKGGKDGEDKFWIMPTIGKLVARHLESLKQEPPIPFGSPDPEVPSTNTSK